VAIDIALVSGGLSMRAIARQWHVNREAVRRHVAGAHLSTSLTPINAIPTGGAEATVREQMQQLQAEAWEIMEAAKASGNVHQQLGAIREARSNLIEAGKLQALLPPPVIDVQSSEEWIPIREAVFAVLEPHPDARVELDRRLKLLEIAP
jgi:hypothetical protein